MTLFSRTVRGAVAASAGLAMVLAGCSSAAAQPDATPGAPLSTASAPGATTAAATVEQSVPPYYAAIWAARSPAWNSPQDVTIRDTYTAKTLVTVKPPAPYQTFSFVTGTSVAGRWVVGAQRWHSGLYDGNNNASQFNQLYLLTYAPASGRATLTPLPVAPIRVNQLVGNVTTPELTAGTHLLAAVALSPDGRQLATVVTSGAGYQVQVVALAGGAVRSWSAASPKVPAADKGDSVPTSYETEFSLTWLSDQRTLAIGSVSDDFVPRGNAQVRYLDTSAPAGSLLAASRVVTPSFPLAAQLKGLSPKQPAPQSCHLPVATSDGATILCGGNAATTMNEGGFENVGFWVLSARTGQLTSTWAPHGICCAIGASALPRIIWASPNGQTAVITGATGARDGSRLFIREATGALRQIPWPGYINIPGLGNIIEPDVAW